MTNYDLVTAFYNGDESALEKLYLQNLKFIYNIAKKVAMSFNCYNTTPEPPHNLTDYTKELLEELCNEGALMLFHCLRKKDFDPNKAKLTTYLYPWLWGAMYSWMGNNVGVLSLTGKEMSALRKVQKLYYSDLKTVEEISADCNLSVSKIQSLISYNTHFLSVYDLVPQDETEETDPYNYICDDNLSKSAASIVYHDLCLEYLKELFNTLSEKDKEILGYYYGVYGYEKINLEDLSLEYMLTVDGVRKARDSAIKKLQKAYPDSKLGIWRYAYKAVMNTQAI